MGASRGGCGVPPVAGWPLVGRGAVPWGASGGQVARRGPGCAETEAGLLRPGGGPITVTFKSRQFVRVLSDRQWQKVLRGVHIERVLHGY